EHRVVGGFVQRAPGLVGDADGRQLAARLGAERAEPGEAAITDGVAVSPCAGHRGPGSHQTLVGSAVLRDRLPVHASIVARAALKRVDVTPTAGVAVTETQR